MRKRKGDLNMLFSLMITFSFIFLIIGNIAIFKCSNTLETANTEKGVDVLKTLEILLGHPCSGGMGWMTVLFIIPFAIIILLTILEHVPLVGRGS